MANRIDFTHHVNVSPEQLWSALTGDEHLPHWLKVTSWSLPLRAGEPFHLTWAMGAERAHSYAGTVLAVEPERQLRLSWPLRECEPVVSTTVQFTLQKSFFAEERDYGGTDLRIVHDGFPDTGRGLHEYDGADRHWRQAAGELAAYLEKRPGKPVPRAIAGLLFVGGAPGRGLLVRDAVVDGPAFVAGIRGGDRILSVNGHELGALDQFHDWIDYCEPGDVGEFVLQNRRVEVTLASPRR